MNTRKKLKVKGVCHVRPNQRVRLKT
ncbi:uncharacterized protein METZ01_LOCUS452966 [marine metagenome]|uniref:Uncharacterized protein n=1 Tax=marine metagenome TaxID=408172 RepID=A0A382ZXB3_9ZZZZ